jgi:hypothetical protein
LRSPAYRPPEGHRRNNRRDGAAPKSIRPPQRSFAEGIRHGAVSPARVSN